MEKQPSSTWGRGGKFPWLPVGSRRAGDAGGAFPLPDPQLGLGRAQPCDTEPGRRGSGGGVPAVPGFVRPQTGNCWVRRSDPAQISRFLSALCQVSL